MFFVEYDDMVQTVSTYTADQPFHIRILPGRLRCCDYLLDTHMLYTALEESTIETDSRNYSVETGRGDSSVVCGRCTTVSLRGASGRVVFVVFALIKLVVIWMNPASWKSVVKAIYGKPVITIVVSLIAGVGILMALLQELTIVQIFASMTFMMALMMMQFAALGEEVSEIVDKFLDDKRLLKKIWFVLLVWIILMGWTLYEIFV